MPGSISTSSASRFSFFFAAHNDFFEEVAKFRAARRLWARLLQEQFGARDPLALSLRFHTQTAGSTLTAQQAENNLARTALQALSAILGGTQSLHVNGYDEALALPSEEAARAWRCARSKFWPRSPAWRRQSIRWPVPITSSRSPRQSSSRRATTSTVSMRWAAWWPPSNAAGCRGKLKMLPIGTSRRSIAGETVVVGVNRFVNPSEDSPGPPARDFGETAERAQIERVRALRARRDPLRWQAALDRVTEQARSSGNVMPAILEAVESCATVGEIAGGMRKVFGEYVPTA